MAADRIDELPVVIAGAGPAGLVAAITLARNGVGSLLVERNPGRRSTLDPSTATALQMKDDGAVLVRPDAQVVTHWPTAPAAPAGPAEAAL